MCLRKFVVMHIERLLNMDDLYKRIEMKLQMKIRPHFWRRTYFIVP